MSLPAALHRYTLGDYLRLEEHSPVRHELVGSEIYAMAGGTPEHAALAASVLRLVGNQLPAGCRTYTSDLRIRVAASQLTTYPDGAVICGKVVPADDDALAATNPALLIEVTSDSTEDWDRGAKRAAYQQIDAVRELLFISHRERLIELHRRCGDGQWSTQLGRSGDRLQLDTFGGTLVVDEVYDDIL